MNKDFNCKECQGTGWVRVKAFGRSLRKAIFTYGEEKAKNCVVVVGCRHCQALTPKIELFDPFNMEAVDPIEDFNIVDKVRVRQCMMMIIDFMARRISVDEFAAWMVKQEGDHPGCGWGKGAIELEKVGKRCEHKKERIVSYVQATETPFDE